MANGWKRGHVGRGFCVAAVATALGCSTGKVLDGEVDGWGASPTSDAEHRDRAQDGAREGAEGSADPPDEMADSSRQDAERGGDPPETTDACASAEQPAPGAQDLRRLSARQFAASVSDLLPGVALANPFPAATVGIFDTAGGNNTMTATSTFDLSEAAAAVAMQSTTDLPALLGCTPAPEAQADGCITAFVRDFGGRAFRRPLSEGADGELEALLDLYATLRSQEDPQGAVAGVVEAILQSPQFLYIANTPTGAGQDVAVVPLGGYALASRLSYFLWNSPPDAILLAAARAGELGEPAQLATQARRMLGDPRARSVVRSFHRQWLNLRPPTGLQRDTGVFPGFGPGLVQDLYEEVDRFVDHVVWESEGTFTDLMTDPTVFANARLEALYGLPPQSSGPDAWHRATLAERPGLLTRGAFLVNHAHVAASSPIQRGVFVIRRMLCQSINVPDNVDTSAFEPGSSQGMETIRDKLAQHRRDPSCSACHQMIDPIGLAFEHFDAVGGYRSEYPNGALVDAAGSLASPAGEFEDATGLLQLLADDGEVQTCYAQQWLSYAIGRNVGRDDRCSVHALRSALEAGGTTVQDLLVSVTQTDAFRFRQRPELEAVAP